MFCAKCGAKLNDGAKFCPKCGVAAGGNGNVSPSAVGAGGAQQTSSAVHSNSTTKAVLAGLGIGACVLVVIGICVFFIMKGKSPDEDMQTAEMTQMQEDVSEETITDAPLDDSSSEQEQEQEQEEQPEPEEQLEADPLNDPEAYFLPDSAEKELTEADLEGMSAQELTYARNELFARHGYVFQSDELNTFFKTKSWYSPNKGFDASQLSARETANAEFIRDYQATHNLEYTPQGANGTGASAGQGNVTPDGEYDIWAANVVSLSKSGNVMTIKTQEIDFNDGWDAHKGAGTIIGDCSSTQYCINGVGEPFVSNVSFDEMKAECASERGRYEEAADHFQSPAGLHIIVKNGKIVYLWIQYS